MGIKTSLAAITPNQSELTYSSGNGADLNGLLAGAQQKALDLIQLLKAISNALPANDPNIASIAAIITQLS